MDTKCSVYENEKLCNIFMTTDLGGMSQDSRKSIYDRVIAHMNNFHTIYCLSSDLPGFTNSQDFWWFSAAKKVIYLGLLGRGKFKRRQNDFMQLYIYSLLECLDTALRSQEFTTIVYPRIQDDCIKGFKYYIKEDGKWSGKGYVKFNQ